MTTIFEKCTPSDAATLRALIIKTFTETVGQRNSAESLQVYFDTTCSLENIQVQLSDPHSAFYFLYVDAELAGYLKLNEHNAQTDIRDRDSLEIERIYLSKEFHSKGLGSVLLNKAEEIGAASHKKYLWLGVWEKNEKAIAFYQRNGFRTTSTHPFLVGEEVQNDLIMRKDLATV
ncbi:MAG: GNAT family N-acetyltransferase [Clostridia bacterium]